MDGSLPFDTTTSVLINIRADRFDQSNALTREFYQKLGFGGYLSETAKDEAREGLNSTNHYSGGMQPGLRLTFLNNSGKYGYIVAYEYSQLSDLNFSDDLFNLAFEGNSYFKSDPADLSDTRFQNQSYQHINFGLIEKVTGSFLSLGIYDGIRYQSAHVNRASLRTEYNTIDDYSYASEISLEAENLMINDAIRSYSPFRNGYGFGLSGAYNLKTDIGHFSAEIRDLGLMRWTIHSADTSGTFHFEGLNWHPDAEGKTEDFFDTLRDSLKIHSEQDKKWVALPTKLSLSYISQPMNDYFFSARLSYYFTMGYYPELTLSLLKKYGERNTVWVSVNAGGFNYFDLGLGTQIRFFERSFLTLGTRNLSGLLLNKGHAQSVFVEFMLKL